jgi:O-antigen/teichoic acid export membrane protein
LRYFKNTGWLFFGRIGGMIISFIVTTVIARYLGPENYGVLSYAVSFTGLFSFVAALGLDTVLYRDLINYPDKKNGLLGTGFYLKLIGGIISFLSVIMMLFLLNNTKITNYVIVFIALSFIFQPFNVINYYFQSKVISKNITIVSLCVVFLLSLFKLVVVLIGKGLLFFSFVFFIEPILYATGYVYLYTKSGENIFKWTFEPALAKSMLFSSWPLILTSAFSLIYSRIDQVMIKQYLDVSSVGIYDVAVRIAEVWYFVPGLLVTSLFPAVVNAKKTETNLYLKRVKKLFILILSVSLLLIIPIYFASSWIIKSFFGTEYLAAIPVLKIYIWAGIGMAVGYVINHYFITENKTGLIFVINFFAMVLNVTLNVYLIPTYGISGAAIATFISYLSIPALTFLFIKFRMV